MAEHNNFYSYVAYCDLIFDQEVSRVITPALWLGRVRAIRLDLNPAMITLAQNKSAAERVNAIWTAADMRHIQLDEPVDVAFCMFDLARRF